MQSSPQDPDLKSRTEATLETLRSLLASVGVDLPPEDLERVITAACAKSFEALEKRGGQTLSDWRAQPSEADQSALPLKGSTDLLKTVSVAAARTFDQDDGYFLAEDIRTGLRDLVEAHPAAQRRIEEMRRRAILDVFGAPDVICGAGNSWFLITDDQQAKMAGDLSETAIGHFYSRFRKGMAAETGRSVEEDNHDWLIMLDSDFKCRVVMASLKEGQENIFKGLADCHITGFRNAPALPEFEADIRTVCLLRGLVYTPNHMGRPIEPEDDTPSP